MNETEPHAHPITRRGMVRESAAAADPTYQTLKGNARYAAELIQAEEVRNESRLAELREARDRAMARLVGWGASYAAAGAAAGLSKTAAAAAVSRYPDEVEAGREESQKP